MYARAFLLGAAILGAVTPVAEPEAAVVEALQMPAWVERDGKRMPLRAGMALDAGDKLATGPASRLLLRMDEGSHVRLGEEAGLDVNELAPPADEGGVFKAAIQVLKGAFRFTTATLAANTRRDVEVGVGAVTIGIRGTDIWGKSDENRDLVCLLEGKIKVQKKGYDSVTLDEPLSFYVAPKDAAPLPVDFVPLQKVKNVWSPQTALQDGDGVVRADGPWSVNLSAARSKAHAQGVLARLHSAGYAADMVEIEAAGETWYRIRIVGFASEADARAFAARINGRFGVISPWVSGV